MNLLSAKHKSRRLQVTIRGVRAGANQNLINLLARQRSDGGNIPRGMRTGSHGLNLREVELHYLIIRCINIREQFSPVLFTPLRFQESTRGRVTGEDRGGHAKFSTHIGDRSAGRHTQCRHPGTAIFDHAIHIALCPIDGQHLERNILCRNTRHQFPGQLDKPHLGRDQIERTAPHGHSHINPAGANRYHADAAASRCMRVTPEKRRPWLAKTFQMKLMAYSVARSRKDDTVALCHALQVSMVIGIFKADLNRVMVHITDR